MVRIRGNLQQSMCFVFSQKVWKIQPTKMLCEMCQNCIKNFYTSAIESTGGVVKSVTIANEESNQANLHPEENSFTYGFEVSNNGSVKEVRKIPKILNKGPIGAEGKTELENDESTFREHLSTSLQEQSSREKQLSKGKIMDPVSRRAKAQALENWIAENPTTATYKQMATVAIGKLQAHRGVSRSGH